MHAKIKHFFLLYCIITLNIPILNAYETKKALVEFQKNNLYLNVKVADTKESRIKGLMHIKKLDAYSGMLFVFPENKHASIWMKNTLLSLDIYYCFFRSNSKISIKHDVTTEKYIAEVTNYARKYKSEIISFTFIILGSALLASFYQINEVNFLSKLYLGNAN